MYINNQVAAKEKSSTEKAALSWKGGQESPIFTRVIY
jgi:hypothetical protein